MKVILKQTVPKVGKEGTVVNVADGFARNYLFPRGLATVAEKKQVEALNRRLSKAAEKTAGEKASMEALGAELNGKTIRIEGQVGQSTGKLFGAITSQNIVDAIAAQLGKTLDKKQVALIEPIKRLGTHQVELDLHRDVNSSVNVVVFDPQATEEEAPAAEAAAEETTEEA
ncbi:MAG: 50S ribosomal protein L9 [Armatimonadetes bacterium]|nr:50S ribosomal protein L9 [Armatimonadota bacterium]